MAGDKKSFLLYTDVHHTVKHLSDEQAGKLFKHILSYVNDENPTTDDPITNIAFEPIKQSLKRDLKKYQEIKKRRSKAGKVSAENRKKKKANPTSVDSVEQNSTNPTSVDSVEQNSTKSTVSVSDSDSDSDSVRVKKKFSPPPLEEVKDYFRQRGYTEESAAKAWDYYTSNEWHDQEGKPVKSWKQKMIAVWMKEENKIKKKRAGPENWVNQTINGHIPTKTLFGELKEKNVSKSSKNHR